MINNTMQHNISNAIARSPGVKQSFVISIGTFHEASAIIPVLWDWTDCHIFRVEQWPNDLCTRFYRIGICRGSFCTSLCTLYLGLWAFWLGTFIFPQPYTGHSSKTSYHTTWYHIIMVVPPARDPWMAQIENIYLLEIIRMDLNWLQRLNVPSAEVIGTLLVVL
jgi:hypothetical protein